MINAMVFNDYKEDEEELDELNIDDELQQELESEKMKADLERSFGKGLPFNGYRILPNRSFNRFNINYVIPGC